jgi:ACS family tartrate transporter-like MFS transporter
MINSWLNAAPTLGERTRRRVTLHLIPFLFFLYILAYLDRINVSVAKLGMSRPPGDGGLGFSDATIGFGLGVFFWGYWILEIPSTVSVLKVGARWVFVRILILWGLSCALIGAIDTPWINTALGWLNSSFGDALFGAVDWTLRYVFAIAPDKVPDLASPVARQFHFLRFLLGFFEGGFFPSVIVYLSLWFRAEDRAKAIAGFMSAIPLSSVVGAPVSGLLLHIQWFGLEGWRWIFILQGIAPILAGFVAIFFLPNRPANAHWLPPEERNWLMGELDREHKGKQVHGHWLWLRHAGIVLLLTSAYFCLNITTYGLSTFIPSILKNHLVSLWPALRQTPAQLDIWASVVTACLYLFALIAMLVNGWHSDRRRERIWHVAVPLLLFSLGIFLTATFDAFPVLAILAMIVMIGSFMYAHLPAYWPIPTMFLGSLAAASATGFINMTGNLGGFVGPVMVGIVSSGEKSYAQALFYLVPLPLAAALIVLVIGYARRGAPVTKEEIEEVQPLAEPPAV